MRWLEDGLAAARSCVSLFNLLVAKEDQVSLKVSIDSYC